MKTITFTHQIITLILIYLLPVGIMSQELEFVQHIVTTDFDDGFDVIAEDLNQDGFPDIIGCAKTTIGELSWWKNIGNNDFEKIVIKEGFDGARSVRAKDINGDGEIDLVSAALQINTIMYFENDGNENFTEYVVDSEFVGAHTIDLKDLNDDGHIDILCSGFDYLNHEGEIAWWENDGQIPIVWTKHLISDRFQQSPFIYGEDMDDDEDIDVIACGELNDEILWWENDGTGEFPNEYMVDSLFDAAHTVIARDVDSDGDMDILGAACMSSNLAWYENDGEQNFTKHPLPQYAGALWLDAIDVDNDGDNDLFGAGMSESKLNWWQNNGNQVFFEKDINGSFTQGFSIVPVFMDNDNDVDFVAIGYGSNRISWFENKLEDPLVYNHPESCVYDYENQRWLISNTGGTTSVGNIFSVENDGTIELFKDEIDSPCGMSIAEGVLYVSNWPEEVYGFDLETGEEVFFMEFNPQGNVDGQTYDNDGHLFVVDTFGKIYKIYLETNTVSLFVSGLTNWTQDIVFDEVNNRLLSIAYALNAPIQAISLEDSTVTNFSTSYSYYDGITMDQFGNVYLASHQSPGRIVKYFAGLLGDHEVISTGHNEPAGLFYNVVDNIIAVPNYGGNSVDFIPMGTTNSEDSSSDNTEDTFAIFVYPNPNSGIFTVEFSSGQPLPKAIEVYNLCGQKITSFKIQQNFFKIDLSNLYKGMYFLSIETMDKILIKKVIKE